LWLLSLRVKWGGEIWLLGIEEIKMAKKLLWSISITVRNPERLRNFLKVLEKIEGEIWNNETQCKYQTLLI
jgi:hypothetical protein